MSRLLKTVILSAYCSLIYQFIKSVVLVKNIEIIEIDYVLDTRPNKLLQREIMKRKHVVSMMRVEFEKLERLPTDYKYILKWTDAFVHYMTPLNKNQQKVFLDYNCTFKNCYLTTDRRLLSDVRHFDAILFDVENNWDFHPHTRSPYQKFIFVGAESAENYPLCYKNWDDYYNLTWTYRLDSDIRWSYITILDTNGTFVGPKINMTWIDPMDPTPDTVRKKLKEKNKTAAWFVSHCNTQSRREDYVHQLQAALSKYGWEVDIFGWCSKLQCPRDRLSDCLDVLEKEYYFYLSFENSFAEDYVTEKLLYAVQHYTVPIVFGGANYSRFLPPGSYIDAGQHGPEIVASLMHEAINNPDVYADYFRWHNHYSYKLSPEDTDICDLCERLNEPLTFHSLKNLRKWWHNDYEKVCKINTLVDPKVIRRAEDADGTFQDGNAQRKVRTKFNPKRSL